MNHNEAALVYKYRHDPSGRGNRDILGDYYEEIGHPLAFCVRCSNVPRAFGFTYEAQEDAVKKHYASEVEHLLGSKDFRLTWRHGLPDTLILGMELFLARGDSLRDILPHTTISLHNFNTTSENRGVDSGQLSDAQRLASCEHMQYFSSLRLPRVTDQELRTLCASEHLRNVWSLQFDEPNFGYEGIKAIANSPHMSSLHDLSITGCTALNNKSLQEIAGSPSMKNLRFLNFVMCGVRNENLRILAQSPILSDDLRITLNNWDIQQLGDIRDRISAQTTNVIMRR